MRLTTTYLVSVLIYLLHILRRINFFGRVRAFYCEFWESEDLKREALAVGNVPVQYVELQTMLTTISRPKDDSCKRAANLDPGHGIECALYVGDWVTGLV